MSINPKIGRPTFKLVFATHEDAKSWEFGKAFLNFLKTHYPDLFPEFLGHCEPINVPVSDDNPLNSIKPYWVEDMSYWRRKSKINSEVGIYYPVKMYPDGMSKLYFYINFCPDFNLGKFLLDAASAYKSDFSALVVETKNSQNLSESAQFVYGEQISLPAIRTYKEPMANLAWAQFMSNRFMARFFKDDRERVSSLTAEELGFDEVRTIDKGLYWRLTPSPYDVDEDFTGFNKLRDRAKEVIGSQFFLDPEKAREEANQPPDFSNSMVAVVVDTEHESPKAEEKYEKGLASALRKAFFGNSEKS